MMGICSVLRQYAVNRDIKEPPNAAVERPRDDVSSAPRVHNEVTHMRRARDAV